MNSGSVHASGGNSPANPVTTGDDEAPKDPGAGITHQSFSEKDYEGHRAHTVYLGVHLPGEQRRHRRHHKHHHSRSSYEDDKEETDNERPITPPAQRVQFILGEDVGDDTHESHPLFSEMEELVKDGDEMEWKETARWIKFEEDVEEGGNRWSKPHVATLSLHALFELRSLLLNGTVMLDMEASSLEQITDLVLDNMMSKGSFPTETRDKVREALLVRHRHQHQRRKDNNMSRLPIIRSLAEIGRNHSSSKNLQEGRQNAYAPAVPRSTSCPNSNNSTVPSKEAKDLKGPYLLVPDEYTISYVVGFTPWLMLAPIKVEESNSVPAIAGLMNQGNAAGMNSGGRFLSIPGQEPGANGMDRSPSSVSISRNHSSSALENGDANHRANTHFMRKIPPGAEASNILVGEVDFLDKTLSAFIRLSQAAIVGDLTEVPVPTRFIFILLGPTGGVTNFHEIGRAMATLMSDEVFHDVAYKAKNRNHLLAGIDEFLDAVTVLPPGEWDPTIRIEPPAAIPSQEIRKRPKEEKHKEEEDEDDEQKLREESGLSRTGRLFGGLINDVKRKTPFYFSDFKDALALQSVASFIFLYFACLSPIITFGGLLSTATGKNMAAMESLVSGFVCGIGYGFFSGQPLTILGSTGPVLVFETIIYEFCKGIDWDYMAFRFWIGTWITIILVFLVAIDASAFVCYITRFTEENFATLIAFIFIYKAIENVLKIGTTFPINTHLDEPFKGFDCWCAPPTSNVIPYFNYTSLNKTECLKFNGTLHGSECNRNMYVPDVFLMSTILFMGTFIISVILKDFKNGLFFPSKVRAVISDFAVIIAILSMSCLDFFVGIKTPKLEVPHEFKPTLESRGWMIWPFQGNPYWSAILAALPALLGTILIFMDQQITAVIVNRKENKLRKGCGYHLDLFVLAILIEICSIMGLPWFVAATVLSINHVNSLKLESECAAPGEKPQFLGVREQRVTHILIFLMIGCSVLLTPMLSHIPMPVLFGVFLYMGVASLKGLQFFDRILIMFMPQKYQPDYMFLRQVPLKKVHLFTIIQLACLACLWTIKSFSSTSILFPIMLVVMIGIRKALDFVFTQRELKILDDVMPETSKKHADELRHLESGEEHCEPTDFGPAGNLQIPLSNGNIMKIPLTSINISEEVNKSGIWQQVNENNEKQKQHTTNAVGKSKKPSKKDANPMADETTRLTTIVDEDHCSGISIKIGTIRSKDSISPKANGTTPAETPV